MANMGVENPKDSTNSFGEKAKRYFVYSLPESDEGKPLGDMGLWREGVMRFGKPKALEVVGGGRIDGPDDEDMDGEY